MPGIVTITRGDAAPVLTRAGVAPGMVFSVKRQDGRLGRKYASIGKNGRMYSVNIDTGELASSGNGTSNVTLAGKWKFDLDRNFRYGANRIGQRMLRSEVKQGEVFTVDGGAREYAHLGRISRDKNGWLSVPLDNTDNHAVTKNGDSHVTVVATFKLAVTLTK